MGFGTNTLVMMLTINIILIIAMPLTFTQATGTATTNALNTFGLNITQKLSSDNTTNITKIIQRDPSGNDTSDLIGLTKSGGQVGIFDVQPFINMVQLSIGTLFAFLGFLYAPVTLMNQLGASESVFLQIPTLLFAAIYTVVYLIAIWQPFSGREF